jgi:hypothetical protein
VNFFGEISGMCYSTNSSLYVGIADPVFGGLLEMDLIENRDESSIEYSVY